MVSKKLYIPVYCVADIANAQTNTVRFAIPIMRATAYIYDINNNLLGYDSYYFRLHDVDKFSYYYYVDKSDYSFYVNMYRLGQFTDAFIELLFYYNEEEIYPISDGISVIKKTVNASGNVKEETTEEHYFLLRIADGRLMSYIKKDKYVSDTVYIYGYEKPMFFIYAVGVLVVDPSNPRFEKQNLLPLFRFSPLYVFETYYTSDYSETVFSYENRREVLYTRERRENTNATLTVYISDISIDNTDPNWITHRLCAEYNVYKHEFWHSAYEGVTDKYINKTISYSELYPFPISYITYFRDYSS